MTVYRGLDRATARPLGGEAHLAQSIADILFTLRGTRVMRRDYGSDLPALIDAPVNGETAVEVVAAVAEALDRWEPRIVLRRVEIGEATAEGRLALALTVEPAGPAPSPTRIAVEGP
jgi:phage baseplate assembly protein W